MRSNVLTLVFSETVKASTIAVTDITLHGGSDFYILTGGTPSTQDSTTITIDLSTTDTNALKTLGTIARSSATTKISFPSSLIKDMTAVAATSVPAMTPTGVRNFWADNVNPVLEKFRLNMNAGTISFTFSETIKASSFAPIQITIQSEQVAGGSTSSVTLSASTVLSGTSDLPSVVALISRTDSNNLKRTVGLAKLKSNTYISITTSAFTDIEGNPVVAILASNAQNAFDYVADTTKPLLDTFDLDFSTELLSLTFNEIILRSSLVLSGTNTLEPGFILQDSAQAFRDTNGDAPYLYALTGGTVSANDDSVIVITLTKTDLDAIKALPGLATSKANTYLSINANLFTDVSGNAFAGLADGSAQQVDEHFEDSVDPTLDAFDLLMSPNGPPLKLLLKFSETMDITTFDVSKIRLQSKKVADGSTLSHRLTNGASSPKPH
jgi:hypothetical protein